MSINCYCHPHSYECETPINTARSIAASRKRSVIVEDRRTQECYRVTLGGHKWRAPKECIPDWDAE